MLLVRKRSVMMDPSSANSLSTDVTKQSNHASWPLTGCFSMASRRSPRSHEVSSKTWSSKSPSSTLSGSSPTSSQNFPGVVVAPSRPCLLLSPSIHREKSRASSCFLAFVLSNLPPDATPRPASSRPAAASSAASSPSGSACTVASVALPSGASSSASCASPRTLLATSRPMKETTPWVPQKFLTVGLTTSSCWVAMLIIPYNPASWRSLNTMLTVRRRSSSMIPVASVSSRVSRFQCSFSRFTL
mmetsp:Transcript_89116/g.224184  ORF Transcript_89116/g.224184 Transcript_89116/m.224184 type:complete len:245 (-) Transcript_89116:617-1351(-)